MFRLKVLEPGLMKFRSGSSESLDIPDSYGVFYADIVRISVDSDVAAVIPFNQT